MAATKDHSKRKHAILSASSSSRWMVCPRSAAAAKLYNNESNDFEKEGTLAHEFAELYARGLAAGSGSMPTEKEINALVDKFDPDRKFFKQEMLDCAEAWRDFIEEHMAPGAVVLLEQRVDFSPWVPGGFGIADCIILNPEEMLPLDYKYGQGVKVEAEGNNQLQLYALGALNDYGALYDVKTVRPGIFQPRIKNTSMWEISAADLLKWADEVVKPTADLAYNGKGEYKAGPHCGFCPHAGNCRKLAEICCKTVRMNDKRSKVENLTPWEINEIIHNSDMVKKWLAAVAGAAQGRLMAGEKIEGLKLVRGSTSRYWTSPEAVKATMEVEGIEESKYMTEPIPAELMSVAQLEKSLGKKRTSELIGDLIGKTEGKITLTTAEDKRAEYLPGEDFDDLDQEQEKENK